jgi:hypothetical protein
MNLTREQRTYIEQALPEILAQIPCDDYSHEDDALFGAILGVLYAQGWRHRLTSEDRKHFYDYIERLVSYSRVS